MSDEQSSDEQPSELTRDETSALLGRWAGRRAWMSVVLDAEEILSAPIALQRPHNVAVVGVPSESEQLPSGVELHPGYFRRARVGPQGLEMAFEGSLVIRIAPLPR